MYCNASRKLGASFLRTVLILSPLANMICQEPLFTHSWMSARAIKLFVVLPQEKRIPHDTTKNVFYSFAQQIRDPRCRSDFPFFSSPGSNGDNLVEASSSFSVTFEAAATSAPLSYLHEHRICLDLGARHNEI